MIKKLTKHRQFILEELRSRNDHPTAKQIFETIKFKSYKLSFATVYNTLEYLSKINLVKKVDFCADSIHYDPDLSDHSHTICNLCNEIDSFPSPKKEIFVLDYFYVETININARGVCKKCSNKNSIPNGKN